jgi:hypothetical protein
LHILLFVFATLAIALAGYFFVGMRDEEQVELQNQATELQQAHLNMDAERLTMFTDEGFVDALDTYGGSLVGQSMSRALLWLMPVPTIIALIVAGATNNYSYLILGQKHCYASFVSSRSGYLNKYIVEVSVKLGVFFGLNV